MSNTIGEAYLQIRPSMEGVKGEIESAMGDAGNAGGASFGSAFGKGLGAVAGVTTAAVGAAAAGVSALTKEAVSSYAEYEQLVGGVETLYGDQFDTVMQNAQEAYKSAGLSANEYMETVNGFAASLTNSLGEEYAWQAANYANEAVIAMADNANKMGTSMESIQNAYAGFAKGNFTMLDNLKLGYGGTKEEMERLLRDAEQLGGYVEGSLSIDSFADITEAVQIIQDEIGISGTTAKEAGETISGSMAAAKSAFDNLIIGFANPDADLGALIQNLVDSALVALNNLMPTIINALTGIAQALPQIVDAIAQQLPIVLPTIIPPLIQAATTLVQALVEALPTILQVLIEVLPDLIQTIIETILTMLPLIIDLGLQLIMALADGLIEALPDLIPAVVDVILAIVDKLTQPDTLVMLIQAALQLIIALATGLIKALPQLIEKAPEIIKNLAMAIIQALPMIFEVAVELIATLIEGIVSCFASIIQTGKDIIDTVKEGISEKIEGAKQWGKDMIDNFVQGIKDKIQNVKDAVGSVAQTVKDILGFSEPDKGPLSNFHTFAPDMMQLFSQGIKENLNMITDAMSLVSGTIATDFSTAQVAPGNHSALADPNERMYGLMGAGVVGEGGNITIPVYIGQEKIDTIILNAQQRHALVSGGR